MKFLFHPNHPDREFYSLIAIFRLLEYTGTKSPDDPFDAAFLWEDKTHVTPPQILLDIARTKPVLNLHCTDISKIRVEGLVRELFGYDTFVDPTCHHGRLIVKSDDNAASWGSIVDGPLPAAEPGSVYQRFIDSEQDGWQVELRTPIVLGTIPEVKLWRREVVTGPINQRAWLETRSVPVDEIYTPAEQGRILEFARRMGLDFGELDVLRANDDGRLYILDVNKTPSDYSMIDRVKWNPEEKKRSIANLARAFDAGLRALLERGPAASPASPP